MAITVFDPDERKRNNQLGLLQSLQTAGQLLGNISDFRKSQAQAEALKNPFGIPAPHGATTTNPTTPLKVPPGIDPKSVIQTPFGNMVVKGFSVDEFGRYKPQLESLLETEPGKKQAEQEIGSSKRVSGSKRFLGQFERSYQELKTAFPEIGKKGLIGFGTRKLASIAESIDQFPETSAFLKRLQPMANELARDIEGGRITDQDRSIYAESFSNAIKEPSQANIRLASEELISLADKGGDISKVVNELASSESDIMRAIVAQVVEAYPDLKPKGFNYNDQTSVLNRLGLDPSRYEVVQ